MFLKRLKIFFNDVLIFADSSDEIDDCVDGYNYFSDFKFYKMWFDDRFLPIEHRQQPYVVVKPKTNKTNEN